MNKMLDGIDNVLNLIRQVKEDLTNKDYYSDKKGSEIEQEDKFIHNAFIDCNRYKYYNTLLFKKPEKCSVDNLYTMYNVYLYTFLRMCTHVVGRIKEKGNPMAFFFLFLKTSDYFYFINNESIIPKELFKGIIAASIKYSKLPTKPIQYYTIGDDLIINDPEQFSLNIEKTLVDTNHVLTLYTETDPNMFPKVGSFCFRNCPYRTLCEQDRCDFMLEETYKPEEEPKKEIKKPKKNKKTTKKKGTTRKGKTFTYKNNIIVDL